MQNKIIQIDDLSVVLGKHVFALRNVDLNLESGQIIGVIGPSGAGKSTLIRSIVGRQKIANGEIEIFGEPAGSASLRSKINYMTQDTAIYQDLTVSQNLHYFATMYGLDKKAADHQVSVVIKTLELKKEANRIAAGLSGGQKQRVSLGIALIGSPKLLVLDEPTVGLDPVLREQIWELFRDLTKSGKTIIISSHVMDEAARCDDLVLIREGKVIAHDTPKDLCYKTKTHTVEAAFLKLIGGEK